MRQAKAVDNETSFHVQIAVTGLDLGRSRRCRNTPRTFTSCGLLIVTILTAQKQSTRTCHMTLKLGATTIGRGIELNTEISQVLQFRKGCEKERK